LFLPKVASARYNSIRPAEHLLRLFGRDVSIAGRAIGNGQVAQLVEQRTENPRVGGSIPSLATNQITHF
jgi:hypothetical protein